MYVETEQLQQASHEAGAEAGRRKRRSDILCFVKLEVRAGAGAGIEAGYLGAVTLPVNIGLHVLVAEARSLARPRLPAGARLQYALGSVEAAFCEERIPEVTVTTGDILTVIVTSVTREVGSRYSFHCQFINCSSQGYLKCSRYYVKMEFCTAGHEHRICCYQSC